jgi:hypothetical protein
MHIPYWNKYTVKEEPYWQQRSDRWLVMRDANTALFHFSANERRKTRIHSLENENGCIINQCEIVAHIVQFYTAFFDSSPHTRAHLTVGFWEEEGRSRLSPFSEKDVEIAVVGMKTESAPGPNESSVSFSKDPRRSSRLKSWTWCQISIRTPWTSRG